MSDEKLPVPPGGRDPNSNPNHNPNSEPLLKTTAFDSTAILVIDRSQSTTDQCGNDRAHRVFDEMRVRCLELPHDNFHVVFWTSDLYSTPPFNRGVYVPLVLDPRTGQPMYRLTKQQLRFIFEDVAMVSGAGTFPHLGFAAIRREFMTPNTMVYFVTDGQINDGPAGNKDLYRRLLTEAIRALRCPLTVIAVEAVARTYDSAEAVNRAAGGDIYQLVQHERLSNRITRFVSYNPVNQPVNGQRTVATVQISRVTTPGGHLPYGDQFFSEARMDDFMAFIAGELRAVPADPEPADPTKLTPSQLHQLAIAQKLSFTLEAMTRDKPGRLIARHRSLQMMCEQTVRTFAAMFDRLDQGIAYTILTRAIERERSGQADVYAAYRDNLKALFARATDALHTHVGTAIGMRDDFISMPMSNRVLTGSARAAYTSVTIHNEAYPHSGFNASTPVFPMLTAESRLSVLQDQCLRQWLRAVYGAVYGVHYSSDEIIYLVLCDMYKVCSCPDVRIEDRIKVAFRLLAECMLRKKRLNSINTEKDVLLTGSLPTANSGKHEDFLTFLRNAARKTGIDMPPMKLWYQICIALDQQLAVAQRAHCDTNDVDVVPHIDVDVVPVGASYEYECYVSLDDLAASGGWIVSSHQSRFSGICAPSLMLSDASHDAIVGTPQSICPACREYIAPNGYLRLGPKVPFVLPESYSQHAARFAAAPIAGFAPDARRGNHGASGSGSGGRHQAPAGNAMPGSAAASMAAGAAAAAGAAGITNFNGVRGKVVYMHGVVGAGKSTASAAISRVVTERGGSCLIVGTDKHCKNGVKPGRAIQLVSDELNGIRNIRRDDVVVVIDTCGDRQGPNVNSAFDVNFTGWARFDIWPNLNRNDLRGYFAWSLYNVLSRPACSRNSTFYLNPVGAGVAKCIEVHQAKARSLFTAAEMAQWNFNGSTRDSLAQAARAYEAANVAAFVMPAGL